MLNPLTWLSRRRFPYEPLIKIEISRERLIHNLNEFRKLAPNGRIAPVLKSNAYGHGLLEVARILECSAMSNIAEKPATLLASNFKLRTSSFIPFFIVDSYYEAVALRAGGIKTPLLIIGYTRPETILISHLPNVSYTISNLESLFVIERARHTVSIHLKIDTGMHRQGILTNEITQAIAHIKSNPKIILSGICSHLCDADNLDSAFTEQQINTWNEVAANFQKNFPSLEYIHLSATDGHRFTHSIKANLSRLGLGLYGITDKFNPSLNLKPVLEMKTIITGLKFLKKGQGIGYGQTFKANRDMSIATIAVGYFEGLDRRLSNVGSIDVGPDRISCPIIGRVSMNITSIDISAVPEAKIGTEVVVISRDPLSHCSIPYICKHYGTFEYETAVHIPEHLKRVVVK